MPQQPAVTLTDEERRTLETFVHRGISWQFTSRDARRKLERLYPVKAPSSD